jgi:membrane associated rhomboid family serine protease
MATCDVCGEQESMPYQCRHCKGTYCREHRLPENHNCPGLQAQSSPGGVFDSGFDDSVDKNESQSTLRTRMSKTGGPLSYFRGNMTYVFLVLMGITFLFQYIILPLFGVSGRSPLWSALFVLSAEHPFYVWTWITSIFAHGGFTHIFVNGFVLLMFGPVVERQIGWKKFSVLFIVSGVIAGLAQIGLVFVLSSPMVNLGLIGSTQASGVLGASGAIMAVMGVLTVLNPDLRVLLFFLIPMPLWVLTIGYAAWSAFGFILGLGGNVAHIAHLAGLIIGFIYGERVKSQGASAPGQLQFGSGRGPGRGRGPF